MECSRTNESCSSTISPFRLPHAALTRYYNSTVIRYFHVLASTVQLFFFACFGGCGNRFMFSQRSRFSLNDNRPWTSVPRGHSKWYPGLWFCYVSERCHPDHEQRSVRWNVTLHFSRYSFSLICTLRNVMEFSKHQQRLSQKWNLVFR